MKVWHYLAKIQMLLVMKDKQPANIYLLIPVTAVKLIT